MYFHLNKKKMIFEIFLMNPKIKPTRKTIFFYQIKVLKKKSQGKHRVSVAPLTNIVIRIISGRLSLMENRCK